MVSTNFKFLEDKLDKEKSYWSEKLAGAPALTGLAPDFDRAEAADGDKQSVALELDEAVRRRLDEVCGGSESLVFTALVAALKICLHKYTGDEDIVVGTAVHERYANTASLNRLLALRDRVSGRATGKELLQAVKRTLAEAYANQKYPLEKIIEQLNHDGAAGRTSLFSVVVILENINNREHVKRLKNDLTLYFSLNGGGVEGSVEYNPALFRRETVAVFGEHYAQTLRTLLERPELSISEFDLLTERKKRELVYSFNDTAREYPAGKTIHQLFEEQAARTPAAAAASCGARALTYHQLNARANRLAHYLRRRGLGPGSLVGLYLGHSLDAVAGLLGVLKAGAAYVPLDPEQPRARLRLMAGDAGLRLVLTEERLRPDLEGVGAEAFCLDTGWPEVAAESADNPAANVTPRDLAYVIYTSGSTGRPKGVEVEHRSLVNYVWWAKDVYLRGEAMDFPLYSPLTFDLTVTSLYLPLVTGGRLLVYPKDSWESPLVRILKENRVDVVKLTPSHLTLIEEMDNRASRVRRLVVGGEALAGGAARRAWENFGGRAELCNEYGPTEATVGCMLYRFDPGRDRRAFVPIGRPAANSRIYVLDARLRPAAENALGELYIGGLCLARGYLKRPGLTAERFVPDPFSPEPGARMYRTGDLARMLPGGEVEFAGRADEQVKFHGHRLELGEIRAALNAHPQVRDSAVLVRRDARGLDLMVAYYVSRQPLAAGELRRHLGERLAEETVPNLFVHLPRMPLTVNGKVNYGALPGVEEARGAGRAASAEPRTEVERLLAGIWAEVLGVGRVGPSENFFELGGHSLLATQVASRVRQAFGVELPLRALFESPTLGGLAERVERALGGAGAGEAPPVGRAERGGALPLSFAQQRLWFIHRFDPESTNYNVPAATRMKGALDVPALRKSLNEITRRHEVLRTVFDEVDGQGVQVIMPQLRLTLPLLDLTSLPAAEREAEMQRLAEAEARRPFDLARGPLLRTMLVRLADEVHVLLLTMHHIVSDGWSMGVLVREVAALYQAYREGRESPLAELPIQYADYAVWQRRWLRGEVLERQLDYWRRHLAGAPAALELPTDFPRPAVQSFRGAGVNFELRPELTGSLKELSRREGVTLFMLCLAAWQLLLSRYTGQEDIVVGTPIANRTRAEVEPLIGFFVNTLVLRTDLSGEITFGELLRRVREVCLGAYAHQELPFERLVEELQPGRRMSQMPLFQVAFVMQNAPQAAVSLPGLELSGMAVEGEATKCDLTAVVSENEAGMLCGEINYSTELFTEETIARMVRHYTRVLESVAADPGQRVQDVSLLSEEEERLLEAWDAA